MPAYKTHAIHGELILPEIDKKVDINKEDLKTFCFGPDTLIATDYKIFSYQHSHNVKEYFEAIMRYIKEHKLQDNPEVMAFLYGQLDHYILDIICHPMIYYMTAAKPKDHKMDYHALVEMWIDDYIMEKYGKKEMFYFHKWYLKDKDLRDLINQVYREVYNRNHESIRYSAGITLMNLLDSLARTNAIGIAPLIMNGINIGDLTFGDLERIKPYLNLDHKTWTHPITGELLTTSFDDLFNKASEVSLETIHDANAHIYGDKPLSNQFITNDCTYNTGLPCSEKTEFAFVKQYK